MNYIQALFSLFNAPLFATFIIGMFWKRMTALGRLLVAAARHRRRRSALYLLYLADVVPFNSDLEESFWGAGLAFVTSVVVAVVVTPLDRAQAGRANCAAWSTAWAAPTSGERRSPATGSGAATRCCSARSRWCWPSLLYIPVW